MKIKGLFKCFSLGLSHNVNRPFYWQRAKLTSEIVVYYKIHMQRRFDNMDQNKANGRYIFMRFAVILRENLYNMTIIPRQDFHLNVGVTVSFCQQRFYYPS